MRKRSITDDEIALIKAMISRGMAAKDIQFFFNRPDRSVNSGRISGIRNGTYSNSRDISAANNEKLDEFLASFKPGEVAVNVSVPAASGTAPNNDPVSEATIRAMFLEGEDGWQFRFRESEQHECKEGFGFRHADKWLRAVAALANNQGGYVIFGVREHDTEENGSDRGFGVVGLKNSEFEDADPVEFTKRLKATFDPTPFVKVVTIELADKKVGVIYVQQHGSRPIIAVRNEGNAIKEGDIFFRYSGQSARIKYSDLRVIFDDRERQARESMMPMLEKLLALGPDKAMIADLERGTLGDGSRAFSISEELLDRIKFIREGEFTEKEGAPALRLVGDVQAVDAEGHIIRKGFVTPLDLVNDFLEQQTPYEPKEYIRCAVEAGNGSWLPMHYFACKAGLNQRGLVAYIMATGAPQGRKELYAKRASGKSSAFSAAGGQPAQFLDELNMGVVPEITDHRAAASFGRAIAGLRSQPPVDLPVMLDLLKLSGKLIRENEKPLWLTPIRRGIARLDELYFGEGDWTVKS